jgi:Tol biopolymer transport system component
MYAVSDAGGQPRQLGKPDRLAGELDQDAPLVVDEHGIYVYSSTTNSAVVTGRIAIASLETGEQTIFDVLGSQPLGIVDGVLAYVTTGGVVMGVPIDVRKRKLTGKPVQLVSDVATNATTGMARASLSRDGTLFYQTGTQASQVVIAGLDGSSRVLLAEPHEYAFPRLSPDGRRLAVAIGSTDRRDIWLYDLSSQTGTRLTNEGTTNDRPEWSPDGKRVLYRTDRTSRSAIWWRPADLSADATALVEGQKIDVFEAVMSPDMRNVVYQLDTLGADVYYRGVSGDTTPHVLSNGVRAIETMPRVSPDGRWVAFITDESGLSEVVVQPFPGPGGRLQVSSGGGSEPVWSRDGRRLFYRGGGHLMAATLDIAPSFGVTKRDTLLTDVFQYAANPHANYDVMADGQHFVFLKAAREGNMIVTTNWKAVVRTRMTGSAGK